MAKAKQQRSDGQTKYLYLWGLGKTRTLISVPCVPGEKMYHLGRRLFAAVYPPAKDDRNAKVADQLTVWLCGAKSGDVLELTGAKHRALLVVGHDKPRERAMRVEEVVRREANLTTLDGRVVFDLI